MTEESWGPWIEHDGMGFPIPLGTIVHRQFDQEVDCIQGVEVTPTNEVIDRLAASEINSWRWDMPRQYEDFSVAHVIRYRIRQSSAMFVLTRIVEHPAPLKEAEPA